MFDDFSASARKRQQYSTKPMQMGGLSQNAFNPVSRPPAMEPMRPPEQEITPIGEDGFINPPQGFRSRPPNNDMAPPNWGGNIGPMRPGPAPVTDMPPMPTDPVTPQAMAQRFLMSRALRGGLPDMPGGGFGGYTTPIRDPRF